MAFLGGIVRFLGGYPRHVKYQFLAGAVLLLSGLWKYKPLGDSYALGLIVVGAGLLVVSGVLMGMIEILKSGVPKSNNR